MPKSTSDNFESIYDVADVQIGMSDPGQTSPNLAQGASYEIPMDGAFKITKTDMGGASGMMSQQYAGNELGYDSHTPGYVPTIDNSVSLPVAGAVDPLTFGDPNDTSLDFKDGMDQNTVTIRGGETGDITNYGFDKPSMDA